MTCRTEHPAHDPQHAYITQRQRLALGRALLSFPHCLLLDEATLAFSADIERKLLLFAREQLPQSLFILVTQRFENRDLADRILNLEGGQLFQMAPDRNLVKVADEGSVWINQEAR